MTSGVRAKARAMHLLPRVRPPRRDDRAVHEVRVPHAMADGADEDTEIDDGPITIEDELTTIRPCARGTPVAMPSRFARGSTRSLASLPGDRIGKYELRDKLGSGAFGVVFTARDPNLERDVAIKLLRSTHLTKRVVVQRFLQEARVTARVAHPGIVTIHDCGMVESRVGSTAFIAMELLSGESLTRRLARCGRLGPQAASEVARQIASALEAAHRADVLHRDLKPDNIYLTPDPAMPNGERVKVLDFGLAKLGQTDHTQRQCVLGTPRYMSPEQARSAAHVDHRSDIYALGCILFELVTGRAPFEGDVVNLMDRHQRVPAPRAAAYEPALPPALDDLIAEMLAKDPMRRPQTMGAVQRALQAAGTVHLPVADAPRPQTIRRPTTAPDPQRSEHGSIVVPGSLPEDVDRRSSDMGGGLAGHARLAWLAALAVILGTLIAIFAP